MCFGKVPEFIAYFTFFNNVLSFVYSHGQDSRIVLQALFRLLVNLWNNSEPWLYVFIVIVSTFSSLSIGSLTLILTLLDNHHSNNYLRHLRLIQDLKNMDIQGQLWIPKTLIITTLWSNQTYYLNILLSTYSNQTCTLCSNLRHNLHRQYGNHT